MGRHLIVQPPNEIPGYLSPLASHLSVPMSSRLTTQELDATRAKYRREIIPAPSLAGVDAEIEFLRVSGFEGRALKPPPGCTMGQH
jgi:hypothetical protein